MIDMFVSPTDDEIPDIIQIPLQMIYQCTIINDNTPQNVCH